MGKYIVYKRNTKEYQEIINSFLDKIEVNFPGYYKKEELRNLLYKNLKQLKKLKKGTSIKIPILGYVNGAYHRVFKTMSYTENEEETIEHELFHALSAKATAKRESILKIIAIHFLGQKQLSIRDLEEGITEYLTGCITDEAFKNIGNSYQTEKNVVNKLAKIYGNRVILDYYLGINNHLIELINRDNPKNFRRLNQMLQKASSTCYLPDNFEGTKYPGKKNQVLEDNLIFSLFSKEKLKSVKTIDDFKHNLHELFNFYEADLYRVCYNISEEEYLIQELENNPDRENLIMFNQASLNKNLEKFKQFDTIIRKEWKKLGIDNENLYNTLLLDEIEKFNEFATPIILDYLDYWSIDLANLNYTRNNPQDISPKHSITSKKVALNEMKTTLIEATKKHEVDYYSDELKNSRK